MIGRVFVSVGDHPDSGEVYLDSAGDYPKSTGLSRFRIFIHFCLTTALIFIWIGGFLYGI
jgi:hypothetical protein